jgi:glycosyltransferase involved in cell wall biosynthesis
VAASLLAIVIPCRNRLELLRETIASVTAQTSDAWECVVVDDGSTEPVAEEIARLSAAEPRLRYVRRTGPREGANACRNLGVRETTSDLIVFLDSDDLLGPDCVRERLDAMRSRPSCDFAVFPGRVFTTTAAESNRLFARDVAGDDLDRFLYLDYPWEITSPVWRRGSFERLGGFDETLPSWQDVDLHVRALIAGLRYVKIDTPDHYIRWQAHPDKTSQRQFLDPAHLRRGERLVNTFHARLGDARMLTPMRCAALAGLLFLLAEVWTRRGALLQARRTWLHARKAGLVAARVYWQGVLTLLAYRAGLLPSNYNERLLERFKIAVGFRFEPRDA